MPLTTDTSPEYREVLHCLLGSILLKNSGKIPLRLRMEQG
nr:MAG TPA: hypothetical protein [Caudoviricetes sp.]